ncbi:hypothetical protein [Nostoc sp.]|uniref:hypothetical protein n=1 Tax=Nostoc sp. TaxID=1180 RepID=UPI003FA54FF2
MPHRPVCKASPREMPGIRYRVDAMPFAERLVEKAGYAYADEKTAQWFAFPKDYDLLILDWMLTKVSGLVKSPKFLKAISSLSNHS